MGESKSDPSLIGILNMQKNQYLICLMYVPMCWQKNWTELSLNHRIINADLLRAEQNDLAIYELLLFIETYKSYEIKWVSNVSST